MGKEEWVGVLIMIALAAVCAVGLTFFMVIFCLLIDYEQTFHDATNPRLKFSHFKSCYYIAPNKWSTTEEYISHNDARIDLSFVDYIRYRWWLVDRETEKETQMRNEATAKLLHALQADIDIAKYEAGRKIKQSHDIMKHITRL